MDRSKSIQKAIEQGLSIRQIAKQENITPNTVSYWLKKLGIRAKQSKHNGIRPPKHDLTGQRFGMLIVIEQKQSGPRGSWHCVCQCDCGQVTKPLPQATLLRNTTTSCGCRRDQYKKITGKNSSQFTGYKEIHGGYWSKLQRGAAKRNYKFTISIQEAWYLFQSQDKRCALTGLPITFGERASDLRTASLDRIDSSKGYIPNNVQWVHTKINFMKHTLTQEEFIKLCRKVAEYND